MCVPCCKIAILALLVMCQMGEQSQMLCFTPYYAPQAAMRLAAWLRWALCALVLQFDCVAGSRRPFLRLDARF